jgi:hypothetical protein
MVMGDEYVVYPDFSTVAVRKGVAVVYTDAVNEPPLIVPLYVPSKYTDAPSTLQYTVIQPSSPPSAETPGIRIRARQPARHASCKEWFIINLL